ncbi:hypothetical protein CCR75_002263 [Bremia lactucae]|uniref:Uncharacterized protein n=1 Tax=Bremia lactucae TaxID=4779 RepID=A0A976FN70_BRELC|nr:hypothetical protein CCR75_002263 [Bremia lactucae]
MTSVGVAPKRPVLNTRRCSQQGIAMSVETRPPRELLEKIGISGKEVVKIIKDRNWNIEEPHGLQQQNIYHLPGRIDKNEEAIQNQDFFVGEGELYAFILKKGGLRYLLPDEPDLSDVEPTQRSSSFEEIKGVESPAEECDRHDVTGEQRKWKQRKRLSTARSLSVEKTSITKHRQKSCLKSNSVDGGDSADEQNKFRIDSQVKLELAKYGSIGQQVEISMYESSWQAKGWRAQLLQEIDVHMLRSVAAADRKQRASKALNEGQKRFKRPIEGIGPHVQDTAEILQEINRLMHSIRASQDDLSSMIEAIILKAEQLAYPDRIDPTGCIGIPAFISTGTDMLLRMRDIERYLLLVVAAVRRYKRVRIINCADKCVNGLSQSATRAEKCPKLRALQLSIEESKRELQQLATIIAAEATKSCLEQAEKKSISSHSGPKNANALTTNALET